MNPETSVHGVSRSKMALMIVLGGTIGAALAGAAGAAAPDDVPRIVVKYDPARLSDDAGARALYHRIVGAAKQVCPDVSARELNRAELARACVERSIARAVHDINSPRVAALYADASKRS